jgi:hypothetical protein
MNVLAFNESRRRHFIESSDPRSMVLASRCKRVLALVGLSGLWTDKGPGKQAWRALVGDPSIVSFDALVVLAAWTIWIEEDLGPVVAAVASIDKNLAARIDEVGRDGEPRATLKSL